MKRIETWLSEYSESHKNETNKLIHWICVPLIFFTIFGMIRSIPSLEFMTDFSPYLNWSNIILFFVLMYYLLLSTPLFFGFIVWALIVVFGNQWLYTSLNPTGLLLFSITIFALAWVGQFIGHKIEGKKPSFLEDLTFLLIGPAWLMNFIIKAVKY